MDLQKVPENHPLKKLFRNLTDRALTQSSLIDKDIYPYLVDMLLGFTPIQNFYRLVGKDGRRLEYLVDMLERAGETEPRVRKDVYQHIGDHSMFVLGMFPESLSHGKRCIPVSYYSDTGRRCYIAASELEPDHNRIVVFRKLAEKFERCVLAVHWIRAYTTDPFYQYMFRQFGIT